MKRKQTCALCCFAWALLVVVFTYPSLAQPAHTTLGWPMNFADVSASHIQPQSPNPSTERIALSVADYDNDGDPDVAVGCAYRESGVRPNALYRNDAGTFIDVSGEPVIAGFGQSDATRAIFFADVDGDDWQDIVVINDGEVSGEFGRSKIYLGVSSQGQFSQFDEQGAVRLAKDLNATANAAALADVDQDGDPDIYIANKASTWQDQLLLNNGLGVFADASDARLPQDFDFPTYVAIADVNGDDRIDIIVSNHDPDVIYYNDLDDSGETIGDFDYQNSMQSLGIPGRPQNALVPGDFNNDGRIDLYHCNSSGLTDRIGENTGQDDDGHVIWTPRDIAAYPSTIESRGATVADLNADGRLDVIVMSVGNRPTLLRNTSIDGQISFIDWTPASAIPSGDALSGWSSAVLNADDDGRTDIWLGTAAGDKLLLAADTPIIDAQSNDVPIVGLHNAEPVIVLGQVQIESNFELPDLPAGDTVAAILNSTGDTALAVMDGADGVVATSNRGGIGREEVVAFEAPGGPVTVRVLLNQTCGDANADGTVDLDDYEAFAECHGMALTSDSPCHSLDCDQDSHLTLLDYASFQQRFNTTSGASHPEPFALEILSRD